jgi:hypothetical protein
MGTGNKKYIGVTSVLKETLKHPTLDEEYTKQGINRILANCGELAEQKKLFTNEEKVLEKAMKIFSDISGSIKPWEVEAYVEQILWDSSDIEPDEEWASLQTNLGRRVCKNLSEIISKQLIEPLALNFNFWNDTHSFAGTTSIVELGGRPVLFAVSVASKVSKTQIGIKLAAAIGSYGVSASSPKKIYLPNDMGALLLHLNGSEVVFHHYSNEEMALHKRHFMALMSIHHLETNSSDLIEK